MTKGEAIAKVETWLKGLKNIDRDRMPIDAIERVIREAKANGK